MQNAIQVPRLPAPQYFSGLFGSTGVVVVYLGAPCVSPSWSVWMVPGSEDGL